MHRKVSILHHAFIYFTNPLQGPRLGGHSREQKLRLPWMMCIEQEQLTEEGQEEVPEKAP
jgi:hypothetical protein